MHLLQQSHLYPCQLASIQIPTTHTQKFLFHSPINSYSTIYDSLTHDCDFLNHCQVRYSRLSTLGGTQGQKFALLSNSNNISFVGHSTKILHSIYLDPQQEILSDIASLPLSFINHSTEYKNKTFSLAYLSTKNCQLQDNTFLTIKTFQQNHNSNYSQQCIMNPESQKCIKISDDSGQNFYDSQEQDLGQVSSIKLSVPITISKRLSSESIQIKLNQINQNNKDLTIFEKKSSTLYTYDPEYQTFTSTILCSQDQENQMITEYQSNKICFLSQNIVLNSHLNGLIKLIDQRAGTIVHIRNLAQEMALMGQTASNLRQQNIIKFWNQDKTSTVDHTANSTSQFLINLKNYIYQVDLRSNHLVNQDSVFKLESSQTLNNYEIAQSNDQNICAFTTQGHSNYKAYIVEGFKTS